MGADKGAVDGSIRLFFCRTPNSSLNDYSQILGIPKGGRCTGNPAPVLVKCFADLVLPSIMTLRGELHLKPQKFEHIFVAVITFFHFLLSKYF